MPYKQRSSELILPFSASLRGLVATQNSKHPAVIQGGHILVVLDGKRIQPVSMVGYPSPT